MTDIRQLYFRWLTEKANMASPFLYLAKLLHQRQFYSTVKRDQNREEDGRNLRKQFLEEIHQATDRNRARLDENPCSVLEVLLALAQRMEDMYKDSPFEKTTPQWMHELLGNLKIGYLTDGVLVEFPEYADMTQKNITTFLDRTYQANGDGGLFPLRHPKRDQRELELWAQMGDYCNEKYNMGEL